MHALVSLSPCLARLPVFKTGAFNHSATHPALIYKVLLVRALSKWPTIGLKAQLSPTSRHEQDFAGGHVRGVLLQSAWGLLQRKFSLEFGFEVASQ